MASSISAKALLFLLVAWTINTGSADTLRALNKNRNLMNTLMTKQGMDSPTNNNNNDSNMQRALSGQGKAALFNDDDDIAASTGIATAKTFKKARKTRENRRRSLPVSDITLTLLDSASGTDLFELYDGSTIDFNQVDARKLTVRADVLNGTETVQVVVFAMDQVWQRNETLIPYFLGGAKSDGAPKAFIMTPGQHLMTVTAIHNDGITSESRSIYFDVLDPTAAPTVAPAPLPSVTLSLTLVNSINEQDIGALNEGNVIDLSQVGRWLNVRADSDYPVTTMEFLFDGVFIRTEKLAPFSLGGNLYGNYKKFLPLRALGQHVIDVRALFGNALVGQLRVGFQVIDLALAPTPPPSSDVQSPAASSADQPSDSPSDQPSGAPLLAQVTKAPTLSPVAPNDQPSDSPSDQPSDMPSPAQETDEPTLSPVAQSDQPSDSPSDQPSDMPSLAQETDEPTLSPVAQSDQPSDSPSDQPSDTPSAVHETKVPTLSPVAQSDQPSDSPSDQPSDMPSLVQETDEPTLSPAAQSDQPSDSPSDQPSDMPSFSQETKEPALSPIAPSDQPSDSPSDQPSDMPSVVVATEPPISLPVTPYVTHYFVDAGTDIALPRFFKSNKKRVYSNNMNVTNTDPYPESVFQTQRFARWIKYTFPGLEPHSMNKITLGFAEIYEPHCKKGDGARVIDVTVNGLSFLSNMDVLKQVPCYTAHFEEGVFEADASGQITISFTATVNKPFVSMLEIDTVA